ncbi:MAG: transcription-repair coupling factor [Desulfobulbaceae bacterium]|uniref:Transcription-repair-coupling factor n=1 Tax=Candidatus Desulfatifera sulfidica TaxID=2841691 RepID=A0A8J6N9H7_9BACT|nr:transcription-repair coupling factor [Candidatus Desulfatifera sulfidica]
MNIFSQSTLPDPKEDISVTGLRGSSNALLAATLATQQPCCCIVSDEQLTTQFAEDLRLVYPGQILVYPAHETPPYTPLSPDQRTTASRLSVLSRLQEQTAPFILVISTEALMRKVMPKSILSTTTELIMAGEDCDRDQLITQLITGGYEQVSLVQTPGDFSVRGGIIDLYPPSFTSGNDQQTSEGPLRLDFFGDTIESIRLFDPYSQRSLQELDEAILLPVSDVLFPNGPEMSHLLEQLYLLEEQNNWNHEESARLREQVRRRHRFAGIEGFLPLFYGEQQTDTVLDFLPPETRLLSMDPQAQDQAAALIDERVQTNYLEIQTRQGPALAPEQLFLISEKLTRDMARFPQTLCTDFPEADDKVLTIPSANHQLLKQEIALQRRKQGLLPPLSDQIRRWQNLGERVVLCCRSEQHARNLSDLLHKHQHQIEPISLPLQIPEILASECNTLLICNQSFSQGFSLIQEGVHLLSESELFGEMRLGSRKKTKHQAGEAIRFAELNDGHVVVHRDHGLGIYRGLETMEIQGVTNDFMLLEYRDRDRLYLPVDRLNLISRYEGLTDKEPRIDKLGSQNWKTAKTKVKEEVWKVAQELLEIYARRELRQGRRFSPAGSQYHELEESFPYDETTGQARAITETIEDLCSDKPMDRLVCGDVGYGKTEVAVRAAFKVVEDGFQTAILVPTTVLAEQHAKTFMERLQDLGVTVECLNRFRSPAEQRRITKDLAAGKIDIIIGTHRLLSKDVTFRNLGLLIVDEEHRFGVGHKEKIKKIKAEVDVLTLTATPIPRTLQMSLLGIRDLSVISSPPAERRPVKTFVARYDELVLKEAITREIRRGGQVFLVHNRVKSIHRMAATIQSLVPDARIAVGHGQMDGKELEGIMVDFVNRKTDVLICTTIIESGLDIPSANTIIINRADTLGLAGIYQLRGRVGRSSTQSFAYLLVPSMDSLSKDAKERLRSLMDASELGGGFKLAMSDLQIRGGGNLLGVSQSGQIAAIGYDLYLDLLQKTVADLKARAAGGEDFVSTEDMDPEINLHISAYIPETYIPDISQRYISYRRIAALSTAEDAAAADLMDELADRYGPIPPETRNLLHIVSLKKGLIRLRISKLERGPGNLVFSFLNETPLEPQVLMDWLAKMTNKQKKNCRLTQDGRLIIGLDQQQGGDLFTVIEQTIQQLEKLIPQAQ